MSGPVVLIVLQHFYRIYRRGFGVERERKREEIERMRERRIEERKKKKREREREREKGEEGEVVDKGIEEKGGG